MQLLARACFLLAVCSLLVPPPRAAGQVRSWQVASDNDAYLFWIPILRRPDYEYTNGMWAAVEVDGAPARHLLERLARCEAGRPGCVSTKVEVGHRMYTPRRDAPLPLPGERPYAAWLYAAVTARAATPSTRHSLGAEVGVTGSPALGETLQEEYHALLGYWAPQGWDHQLRFEPGVVVRYDVEHRLAEVAVDGVRLVEVAAEAGGAAGNVLTRARAGVSARVGYDLGHPWTPRQEGVSVYGVAAVGGEAVARNLFLDGNTFGESTRVEREPLVGRWTAGAGVRVRGLSVEYRVATRSREYRTEPGAHQFSTFEITWRR